MRATAVSTYVKMCILHKLILGHLHTFRAASAVNCQTVCNDLYLGSVPTPVSIDVITHADVRTSQHITRLLTANFNFGSL